MLRFTQIPAANIRINGKHAKQNGIKMKRGRERNVTSSLRNGSKASYETHLWVLRNVGKAYYESSLRDYENKDGNQQVKYYRPFNSFLTPL